MSPAEMAHRARDAWLKRRWRARQVRDMAADPLAVPETGAGFASPLSDSVREAVPAAARARLLAAADAVLQGRWPLFDRVRDDLDPCPDWFLDPRTGQRAPDAVYCFAAAYRDEAAVGNVKYLWELSRHHHLTLLAAAYFLSGDDRYAARTAAHLADWWQRNPFLSGIHWSSGIELAMRVIGWVWIRRLLDGWPRAPELFEANPVFLRQLHHHLDFLATFESHGSSANNHLLAEVAGLFAGACGFPYFRETAVWRAHAARLLRRELTRQTFASGLNREQASDYHMFVLELGLAAAVEGEAAGHGLGAEAWGRLRAMVDALAATVDVGGRPPRQGDSDDAVGLLLDAPESPRQAGLLATGAALFGACPWWPRIADGDVRTALWTALAPRPDCAGERPARRPSLFADAGLALLRDLAPRADEIWCRCDHGPHGYLSIAAHAHADALAIELRHGGVDILADPGTYCYHGEPEWRAYFRSTLGHNTLELAGHDQSASGGPFLWTRHAAATLAMVHGLDEGDEAIWSASHDGYGALQPPAVHHRTVRLDRAERSLTLEDRVEGGAGHQARLAFHLGPTVDCTLEGATATLLWQRDGTPCRATLTLPAAMHWRARSGVAAPPLGWYSPGFGRKQPAVTLVGEGSCDGEPWLTRLDFA